MRHKPSNYLLISAVFVSATLALGGLARIPGQEMNMVKLHVASFTVVGLEVRTSNAREKSGLGEIGKLWARLDDENFVSQIPRRVDSRLVAVYSEYASDKDGEYNYLLGAKVSSAKDIPAGMVARKVVSGNYAMFTAQGIDRMQMTIDLWRRIWSLEKLGPLHRAYDTDFEVHYVETAEEPARAHVDVYIGVRD